MAEKSLTKTRLAGGVWEGRLEAADGGTLAPPRLAAYHLDQALDGLEVAPVPDTENTYSVRIALPMSLLSDGVQTVLIRDEDTGDTLETLTLIAGSAADPDMRAELDLLRAELDMLKRAFRRHCAEGD